MARGINPPRTRTGVPPGPLCNQRRGGNHEVMWMSPQTLYRQRTDPSPMAENFTCHVYRPNRQTIRRVLAGRNR